MRRATAARHFARAGGLILIASLAFQSRTVQGAGLTWPTNQLLPTFSTPATNIDCIDLSSASGAEQDLFASLEGIVNRTQPRIACVNSSSSEGEFTWLNIHNLPYTMIDGYSAITKYMTNVVGLVVDDTNLPDTLDLATTIAGVSNELICDPSLLATLTNAPYNLAIKNDLRGKFSDKYQAYQYLYNNYWPQCTHRIFTGLGTDIHANLRDYIVAVKSACVWLDGNVSTDATALAPFMTDMTPVGGVWMGWVPNEGPDLKWIAQYGIPVLASDDFMNGSLYSGVSSPINIPTIPPTPPLQNKVYVAFILSDGDNIQYMQHQMNVLWNSAARGTVPIGWTTEPLACDMDPGMLNYYWSTATTNDCLVSGPDGAGYAHINNWSTANVNPYTKAAGSYLQRGGQRIITVWNTLSSANAKYYATNCPTLVGLFDDQDGYYTTTNYGKVPVIGFPSSDNYAEVNTALLPGITNTAASWNGSTPMFIAVQGSAWDITPTDLQTVENSLDQNEYIVVRPDHLFLLYKQQAGLGVSAASPYVFAQPTNQTASIGTNIIFSASATGSAPLSYQWQLNGTNIAGATTNTYTKTNVQSSDAGNYSMLVTNAAGSVTSSNAVLTVYPALTNAPFATTQPAYGVTSNGATLRGMIAPNCTNNVGWFEWGTNASYGQRTAMTNFDSGYQVVPVSAVISNLTTRLVYHYRVAASNAVGAVWGADQLFTTGGWVKAWGDNSYGQTNVPAGLTNAVLIASGAYHALALQNNGAVVAWGMNANGQTNVPASLTNVIALAAGYQHSLALKPDGTVVAWGGNGWGQTNVPAGLTNVIAIAAGAYHSLALNSGGTVVSWGYNNDGQTNVPAGLVNVVGLAAGLYHSLVLKADGTVLAWGDNTFGQTNVPAGLSNVVAVSAGQYHNLTLKTDGTVMAWGRNNLGQTNVPAGLTNVVAIACGDNYNLGLKTDGTIVAWGDNSLGQTNLPPGLKNVAQLAGGFNSGLLIGNQLPQAGSLTLNGYVNHDLLARLSGTGDYGTTLSYRITTLPTAGTLYQSVTGTRGSLINATNTTVSDGGGQIIFAAVTNQTGAPYAAFAYVANDGLNDSLPAQVVVNIALPAPPQLTSITGNAGSPGNEVFTLNFSGSSNATYSVWASINLSVWDWIGTAIETPPGLYQFTDTTSSNFASRFYRVSAP